MTSPPGPLSEAERGRIGRDLPANAQKGTVICHPRAGGFEHCHPRAGGDLFYPGRRPGICIYYNIFLPAFVSPQKLGVKKQNAFRASCPRSALAHPCASGTAGGFTPLNPVLRILFSYFRLCAADVPPCPSSHTRPPSWRPFVFNFKKRSSDGFLRCFIKSRYANMRLAWMP